MILGTKNMKKWLVRIWVHKRTSRYQGPNPGLVVCGKEVVEAPNRKEALALFLKKNPGYHIKVTVSPLLPEDA